MNLRRFNMKMMAKGAVGTLAAVVLLFVAAASVAAGSTWYNGWKGPGCPGLPYLVTTDLATIHSESAAGRLRSYKGPMSPCIDVSIAG